MKVIKRDGLPFEVSNPKPSKELLEALAEVPEMINNPIRDVNYILYVYDSTNLESFQSIKLWKLALSEIDLKSNVVEYLVGNKNELPEKIVTDKASVENLAKKYNFKSWSVSARASNNLKEMFEEMANSYYDNYFKFVNKVKNL